MFERSVLLVLLPYLGAYFIPCVVLSGGMVIFLFRRHFEKCHSDLFEVFNVSVFLSKDFWVCIFIALFVISLRRFSSFFCWGILFLLHSLLVLLRVLIISIISLGSFGFVCLEEYVGLFSCKCFIVFVIISFICMTDFSISMGEFNIFELWCLDSHYVPKCFPIYVLGD